MKYRTKSIDVEAWPVSELIEAARRDFRELPEPVRELYDAGGVIFVGWGMDFRTSYGRRIARWSEYLVVMPGGDLEVFTRRDFGDFFEPVAE